MTQNELHAFVIGERRAEGDKWKSAWRIELERKLAEAALKAAYAPKPIVERAPRPQKLRVVRERRERPAKPKAAQRDCLGTCGGTIPNSNKIGYCVKCCSHKMRNAINLGPRPSCSRCGVVINRGTKTGLCNKHSAVGRQTAYRARVKAKRMELREAA